MNAAWRCLTFVYNRETIIEISFWAAQDIHQADFIEEIGLISAFYAIGAESESCR